MTKSTKEFWEKAYQSNIGKLIGICYRYTKNHQLSEDLAHDAFLKAIDRSGTFAGTGKFEAWLRRIVVNHTLQYLRDRKKDPLLVDVVPDLMSQLPIEENSSVYFTTAELLQTIDQLPNHHRLVFNLYVLEEFTHAQIGEELGISEGTSKSHLARARRKLQQLLTQKVQDNQNESAHKKALILLLTGGADENIDQLFREGFNNLSIPAQKSLSLKPIVNAKLLIISAIASITIIIALVVNQKAPVTETTTSVPQKNTATFQTPTATLSQDSVIPKRNLKQKPMKPLDSLALMLVLASGSLNEVTAKDSIKEQIEKYSQADTVAPPADPIVAPPPSNPVNTFHTVRKDRGTFRASEVYWSETNNEVYFKGKVRVNFGKQRFHGDGTFTFLGKIQLLVIDGQQVTLGKIIPLTDDDYKLVTLNSKEATEKYGDKGMYGAAEISRK